MRDANCFWETELKGQALNFSNEIQVTVTELVDKILHLMKSDLQPQIQGTATNEIRHQYLSAARAKNSLGWSPLFTLEQGLEQTISWYRDFLYVGA